MSKQQAVTERKDVLPDNSEPAREKLKKFVSLGEADRPFLILVIILTALGSIMMFSASYAFAETNFNDSLYFAKRQIIWIVFGFIIMAVTAHFATPELLRRLTLVGYIVTIGLNVLVLIMGIATHGAVRQLDLGFVSLQPSELLKTFNVLLCARIISFRPAEMKKFRYGVIPFAVLALISAALCIGQNHLSATIINILLIFFMMIIGGTHPAIVGSVGGVGAVAMYYVANNIDSIVEKLKESTLVQSKLSHVVERLIVWQDPFKYMKYPELNDPGWQPSQSLYAISAGGVWGLGLGKSVEKHGYLPEPQNDYIFAIICEELGFAGAVFVICLFALLIIRGFQIAIKCSGKFEMMIIMGLVIKVAIQVVLNIAVVTNTIPSTGITLPFFSYGGTSLCILMAEMGIILSLSKTSYIDK